MGPSLDDDLEAVTYKLEAAGTVLASAMEHVKRDDVPHSWSRLTR